MSEEEKQYDVHQDHTEGDSTSSHSEHHHHSHHHHSKHRRRRAKKPSAKKSFWERLKKDKKLSKNLAFIAGTVVLLTGIILLAEWASQKDDILPERSSEGVLRLADGNTSALLSVPYFDEDVYLAGEAVLACMDASPSTPVDRVLEPFQKEDSWQRLDTARPVTLEFDVAGLPSACTVAETTVEIREEGETAARVFSLKGESRKLDVPHLKTGTDYRYRINLKLSDGNTTSVEGSFRTAQTPRILNIEGIGNVRDIGGWKTTDGSTIRQGLLYRGTELDGAVEAKFSATQNGIHDMLSILGIRTDMDLRAASENRYGADALGINVKHTYYNAPMYEEAFSDWGKAQLCAVFADLADESSYPVYLHCTYGLDRTGIVCYLLEALLGLSEADLMREYELSALYYGSVPYDQMDRFVEILSTFAGSTMQEKTENFLLSTGVTPTQIRQIRQIFTD